MRDNGTRPTYAADRVEISGVQAQAAAVLMSPSEAELRAGGSARLLQELRLVRALLRREREILESRRLLRLKELEESKLRLIGSMQGFSELMRRDPAWAASVPEAHKLEIRRLHAETMEEAEQTMAMLRKAKRAQDVLMQAIRRAVDGHFRRQRPYDALTEAGPKHAGGAPLAVRHDC